MTPNRLISEKSPYLLQHAHNPVDWYPWGIEAFEKAKREDKPIFLSVGYSTCHWCHVMERESFENEDLAALLNQHFVAVKLDREERPDIDRVYMTFVQATTGGGGWPMSVFLTPDRKPFFGGTYFPPEDRFGRPGFRSVLRHLATHWETEREKIITSSEQVLAQLQKYANVGSTYLADAKAINSCFYSFRRGYDRKLGGFGGAPKFPRPSVLNFLLRYGALHKEDEAREMAENTLAAMADGGMNDQLGGGFHRYSVDERWFVPHFEKMLYDQAQLAIAYLEGFQATGRQDFADEARRIFRYVQRDMTDESGAFYSAEDADSVINPDEPHEKGEGAFYIYSYDAELVTLLGEELAGLFAYRYGVSPDGNVLSDPHEEFTGRNILYRARTIEECATRFSKPADEVSRLLSEAEASVLALRNKRPRPHLDDKILSSWNGLMISAFATGARILGDPDLLEAAQRAAAAVLGRLYDADRGVLLRRMRDGDAAIDGFLDDYACVAQGLLDLYEADYDAKHLVMALHLSERMLALFEDTERGAFFSAAAGDVNLIVRMKEDYDGAEPSGNSVAVMNLLRLAAITGRDDLSAAAERTFKSFGQRLSDAPSSLPQMMAAYLFYKHAPKQIVIRGERGDARTQALLAETNRHFIPNRVLLLADSDNHQQLAALAPALVAVQAEGSEPAAFVCEHFTCQLPVTSAEALRPLLQ